MEHQVSSETFSSYAISMQATVVSIERLADYAAQSVTLKGWLYN